jgi:hypothetical protein
MRFTPATTAQDIASAIVAARPALTVRAVVEPCETNDGSISFNETRTLVTVWPSGAALAWPGIDDGSTWYSHDWLDLDTLLAALDAAITHC